MGFEYCLPDGSRCSTELASGQWIRREAGHFLTDGGAEAVLLPGRSGRPASLSFSAVKLALEVPENRGAWFVPGRDDLHWVNAESLPITLRWDPAAYVPVSVEIEIVDAEEQTVRRLRAPEPWAGGVVEARVDAQALELAPGRYRMRGVLNRRHAANAVNSEFSYWCVGEADSCRPQEWSVKLDELSCQAEACEEADWEVVGEDVGGGFVVRWEPDASGNAEPGPPRQRFRFRLANELDAPIEAAADGGAAVEWRRVELRRRFRLARGARDCAVDEAAEAVAVTLLPAGEGELHQVVDLARSPGDPVLPPPYAAGCAANNDNAGGKRVASTPYEFEVEAKLAKLEAPVIGTMRQDMKHVIVQEYWDHYPYTGGNPARRINCKSGSLPTSQGGPNATGTCSGANVHPWPTVNDLISISAAAAFTAHYTEQQSTTLSNCNDNQGCGPLVYGNYYRRGQEQLSFKTNPLSFAELIRTRFITIARAANVLTAAAEHTPKVNSGWRNPERNEAIGGVINSNHQWQATLDVKPVYESPENHQQFPLYYEDGSEAAKNRAPLTWCRMAKAAWDADARTEIVIESNRPRGSASLNSTYRFQYYWRDNSVIDSDPESFQDVWRDNFSDAADRKFDSCVDAVRKRIEQCLEAAYPNIQSGDYTFGQRQSCSPDHVHAAR